MAGKPPTRVMVVDDHEVVREGIRVLLERTGAIAVCAEAGCIAEAVEALETARPDLVVVDLRLPDGDGVDLTKEILARRPETQVVVMTGYGDDGQTLLASIMAGASGYVLKDVECTQLIQAVREVGRGRSYLDPMATKALFHHLRRHERGNLLDDLSRDGKLTQLSQQEKKVLALIIQGKTDQQIGRELHIAAKTAGHHASKIYSKLGVSGRTQAVAYLARLHERTI